MDNFLFLPLDMSIVPRSVTGKKRDPVNSSLLTEAITDILKNKITIRAAAEIYNLPKSTIFKYYKKYKDVNIDNLQIKALRNDVNKVFSPEEENSLFKYIEKAAYLHFGLSAINTRKIAYQFAISKNKKIPNSWIRKEKAGRTWLKTFRERFPLLSLRKPEPTSLSRASSFNKINVNKFFENLKLVFSRYKFSPENVYNVDETSLSTVHKPGKILAPKYIRQLGGMTSGERGHNITMIGCINAIGNSIPPMLIFPRVNFKQYMLNGAPTGSIGAAHISGWSNEALFRIFLDHFIQHAKPSENQPVLLIMDNHVSHISVDIIDQAKKNHITLLTIHPHTSHKMQPLDRTVFGPLKNYYNKAADRFMVNNPGKPMTIYDGSKLLGESYSLAFTSSNIIKSFKITGICPLNENVFEETEFSSSYVTDRPPPTEIGGEPSVTYEEEPEVLSLESISPFPKAAPRKNTTKRKLGRTRILTDTPEKNDIIDSANTKKTNKIKKEKVKRNISEFQTSKNLISQPSTSKISTNSKTKNFEKSKIISQDIFKRCLQCKKYENQLKLLTCNMCNKSYHQKCISGTHKENIPDSDDENLFICEKCYNLQDASDHDDEMFTIDEIYSSVNKPNF